MSSPNYSDSNLIVGRNSSSSADIRLAKNIVIGNDRIKDPVNRDAAGVPKNDGTGTNHPRMAGANNSIVLGSGPLTGARIDNDNAVTTALTVVPSGSLCFGSDFRIPVLADNTGGPAANSANHLMFDGGVGANALQPAQAIGGGGQPAVPNVDTAIPVWYNNRRYVLHATLAPAPLV